MSIIQLPYFHLKKAKIVYKCDHDYESDLENEDVYLDLDKNEDTPTNEEFLYPHIDELKYEEYEEEN